jgi:8-oxo-dGTP pyrophosphatase MutT (NUDIX family)
MKPFNAFVIAAAIVRDGDRIMLLEEERIGKRQLNAPGGRVKPFESPSETAVREVKEETGLDIRLLGLVAVVEGTWSDGGKFAKFIFEAEKVGGAEKAEKDFQIHWLLKEEVLDSNLRSLPILKVDEDALVEYYTSKKTITPFFYTFRDNEFERTE